MTPDTDSLAATAPEQTIVLIDGNAMVHRAFHAIPEDMATKTGEIINATFGFASMLIKIFNDIKPNYIAIAFDRPTPTFRHIDYHEYKAHRPSMPDHFRSQFVRVRQLVDAFNIPVYELDGFEADDVLGTLAVQAHQLGLFTEIVTGDMDTLQLVTPTVVVLAAKRGISDIVRYDEAAVEERLGVKPNRVPDWKALTGDTSDNIPGVPSIGDKTATKLLQAYGTLEGVLEHVADLPARQRQVLTDNAAQARKSKWLATIVTDAPVTLDIAACKTYEYDREAVRDLFRELEFHSLVDRLPRLDGSSPRPKREAQPAMPTAPLDAIALAASRPITIPAPAVAESDGPAQLSLFGVAELPPLPEEPELIISASDPDTSTIIVTDETALRILARSLQQSTRFAVDLETDSTDQQHAQIVGISLSMGHAEAYYIPIGHITTPKGEEPGRQLALTLVRSVLGPVLADPAVKKTAHNAKFDGTLLERHGMPVNGLDFDTMIAAYLIDPGRRGLGLKEQAFEVLGKVMTPITDLIGTGAKQITMAQVPIATAAAYAGVDADMTYRLMAPLATRLRELEVFDLFTQIEMPLVPVLARMEQVGILIDPAVLARMAIDLTEQTEALEKAIYETVGHEFNINSPKQLGDLLFTELKLPTGRKTKTGYSVDAEVLENLRGTHPAVDHLLEYRTLIKLKSTYVDGLRELMDPADKRIHTSFNQTIASSGRLSSSNPNLQNIPIRTEVGRQIRRAFVADPGWMLLAVDYAQVELRILAHITHEPVLIAAFAADEDIHRVTASRLYNVAPEEVTKDQRRVAKTITFAIIYGQSPFGLARTSGMPQDEARRYIHTFEESFPAVKQYVRDTLYQVRTQGYVQTLLGRKRFLPRLMELPLAQRQAAEREAINMPIQGTNADIIKLAMISLDAALRDLQLRTTMILQVHDELVFEVPDEEIDLATSLVRAHMENAYKLDVPLRVEMKLGRDWYSTEPVEG